MTLDAFVGKAVRAIASARLLLEDGDVDGACNRAYYAMFDAAKAALLRAAPADLLVAKTHGGLISAFSLHLVKTGLLPVALGKSLNRAHEVRQVADYTDDEVSQDQARDMIEQAEFFVETIRKDLKPGIPTGSRTP